MKVWYVRCSYSGRDRSKHNVTLKVETHNACTRKTISNFLLKRYRVFGSWKLNALLIHVDDSVIEKITVHDEKVIIT